MQTIESCLAAIRAYDGPPIRLMEVCGTHTRSIFEYGIPAILPNGIQLVSGPGCPVCVTPAGYIDRAAQLSLQAGCRLYTFGDMLRVPGNSTSLLRAQAQGGDVRLLYSPLDILPFAHQQPQTQFYLTALGFETTLPLYALLLERMLEQNIRNIRLLTCIKALMPALYWIANNHPQIDGFIGPGHVSAILGSGVYKTFCKASRLPLAVAGFTFEHIVAAIYDLIFQIGAHEAQARNFYPGVVSRAGNVQAQALIHKYFTLRDSYWRGLGEIAHSGYFLAPGYEGFDAGCNLGQDEEDSAGCLCGSVIAGRATPADCRLFRRGCTPQTPRGPCMVSSEGTCGIWYHNAG